MERPLRICHVSAAYYPYPSGVTELVHHSVAALRERGHSVELLTTSYGDDEPMPQVTRFGRARLIPLNKSFGTVPFGLRMSGQVKRFLAGHEFDIVHLHGAFPPDISFYALKHSRTVTVASFHTVGFRTPRLGAACVRAAMRRYNRRLAARLVASKAARDFACTLMPGDYTIIPYGVDTVRFRPGLDPIAGAGPDGRTILFVGRLDQRKGLTVLLRAMPRVLGDVPDARLVVVGRGPGESEARRLVGELGIEPAVRFVGFVPAVELPRYYSSADLYCAPTLGGESFGIVLIEAMAAGAAIVASDITGYNEVVEDGRTGLLVPPGEPGPLGGSLVRLLKDGGERARLATCGRGRAEELSWPRVAAAIEQLYRELLAADRPDRHPAS